MSGKPYHEETKLWVSHDAGDNWEPLGNIQGLVAGLDLAGARRAPTRSRLHPRLIHLSATRGLSSRIRAFRAQIAQVTDTRHSAPLPPLPIAGASPERMGITSVLAETASGKLLVFGLGLNDHVPL